METISFNKLLLKTAFCCMASDGDIDKREIDLIKTMCEKSKLFVDLNFEEEINLLFGQINSTGKEFIKDYFKSLDSVKLTAQEELILIDFAVQTINADQQIEYSEIKFFKNIRHRLKISNENILSVYPDIEQFIEEDIITDTFLEKITNQYLEVADLPQFKMLIIEEIANDEN